MYKLTNIISEILNTYSIEANLFTDPSLNLTDILNQIRAIRKVTIVRNITPEDYPQKPEVEYTKLNIKFITRGDAGTDIEKFKEEILTSDRSKNDLRIPGVKSIKFNPNSLKRL